MDAHVSLTAELTFRGSFILPNAMIEKSSDSNYGEDPRIGEDPVTAETEGCRLWMLVGAFHRPRETHRPAPFGRGSDAEGTH